MFRATLLTSTIGAALVPVAAAAVPLSPFLIADQTRDEILLATDLNGDGDTNDPGEVQVFFSEANASGLGKASGNVFALSQVKGGAVFIGDGDTDSVYRLRDNDGDGSADGAGEAQLWFSGAGNASGFRLNTPNGIAEGPDGAIFIVEADTSGSPTGDWVYRTVDLDGDGNANGPGEATRWLDLKALNPASSPFEIRFDGDTAYIMDTAGGAPNVIYSARDIDGNGVIEGDEVRVFASETTTGARFDFAMDVGFGSVWTWQWLPVNGVSSVFRLTDLDGNGEIDAFEAVEVWNTTLLDPAYTFLAGFGLALKEATGEILITSNASPASGRWVTRLLDLDGDGAFWGAGESRTILSLLDHGTLPQRPRNVAFYTTPAAPAPVPLPAGLPLLVAALSGMAWLRRRAS
jgi:hypothetical protein